MSEWDKMAHELRAAGWVKAGDLWYLSHSTLQPLPLRDAYSMAKYIEQEDV